MVDSTENRASNLNNNDVVLSSNGLGKQITSRITGLGGNLLLLSTNNGKSILIGGDQPIKSNLGWILVEDVKIGTIVESIDGQEEIIQIAERMYNSTIYNFRFDEETGIYANGFLIGDYSMMQRMVRNQRIFIDY
jgi:hypothetical protein